MRRRSLFGSASTALGLLLGCGAASAQVGVWGEAREVEDHPAAILFRSTLFGAGTGLALGGAYALAMQDVDVSEALGLGAAGGAAGGMLIGLVTMIVNSDDGDAGAIRLDDDGLRLSVMGALPEKRRDLAGVRGTARDVTLFSLGL